ncbi:hypothetical protein EV284_6450 [Streptomyces sp. BK022]|nr:hypothetical protein EV284_6450 [Streptomyces sp. BK022]
MAALRGGDGKVMDFVNLLGIFSPAWLVAVLVIRHWH